MVASTSSLKGRKCLLSASKPITGIFCVKHPTAQCMRRLVLLLFAAAEVFVAVLFGGAARPFFEDFDEMAV